MSVAPTGSSMSPTLIAAIVCLAVSSVQLFISWLLYRSAEKRIDRALEILEKARRLVIKHVE